MRYVSVCDGIGAAHVAWKKRGWQCVGASEIAKFPSAVVRHHHPEIKHLGDMTKHHEWNIEPGTVDLVCGGTPCQAFSVAGLRGGLADPRGNLALVFLGIVDHLRPRWVVWENVPGVYSATSHVAPDPSEPIGPLAVEGGTLDIGDEYDADEDHAFACFLAGLSELGYGVQYRSLDAQYSGLAQRRHRVYVVAYLGDWRPATAVLLDAESLQGHPAPRRSTGQGSSADVAPSLTGSGRGVERTGEGFDASEDGTGRGTPLVPEAASVPSVANPLTARMHKGVNTTMDEGQTMVPVAFKMRGGGNGTGERGGTVGANGGVGYLGQEDLAFTLATTEDQHLLAPTSLSMRTRDGVVSAELGEPEVANALRGSNGGRAGEGAGAVFTGWAVRRLTPRECERLQGFPDDYTRIPWNGKPAEQCPDGPRYQALGNSWPIPEIEWIGDRIDRVDAILKRLGR